MTTTKFWSIDGDKGYDILDEAGLWDVLEELTPVGAGVRRIALNLEPGCSTRIGDFGDIVTRMTDDEVKEGGF